MEPWLIPSCPDQRADITQIIREFPDVLSTRLGLTHLIEYEIKVIDPAVIKLHPYKLSPPKMDAMREQINKLLEQKVIEPSTAAYSSPVSYTHLDVYKRQTLNVPMYRL